MRVQKSSDIFLKRDNALCNFYQLPRVQPFAEFRQRRTTQNKSSSNLPILFILCRYKAVYTNEFPAIIETTISYPKQRQHNDALQQLLFSRCREIKKKKF